MKKIVIALFVFSAFFACKGPRGNSGPPGPKGDPGDNILAQTFEMEGINFDFESDYGFYSTVVEIPGDIEVYDSDAVLVYRMEYDDRIDDFNYNLIPQDFYTSDGTIEYLYNHTINDVELMIDGDFDLSNLGSEYTENQTFRFVIVPADWANDDEVNIETYMDLEAEGIDFEEF